MVSLWDGLSCTYPGSGSWRPGSGGRDLVEEGIEVLEILCIYIYIPSRARGRVWIPVMVHLSVLKEPTIPGSGVIKAPYIGLNRVYILGLLYGILYGEDVSSILLSNNMFKLGYGEYGI